VTEPADDAHVGTSGEDAEIVDAVPVPDGAPFQPPSPAVTSRGALATASPVAVQAAAVAMTGFAAGAATVAVVRRRRARRSVRAGRKVAADVRATRSFLVDIHLLNRG
jgi:hypothetical protein